MRSYYTIHDIENFSVGFAGLVTINKNAAPFIAPDLKSSAINKISTPTPKIDPAPSTSNDLFDYNPIRS